MRLLWLLWVWYPPQVSITLEPVEFSSWHCAGVYYSVPVCLFFSHSFKALDVPQNFTALESGVACSCTTTTQNITRSSGVLPLLLPVCPDDSVTLLPPSHGSFGEDASPVWSPLRDAGACGIIMGGRASADVRRLVSPSWRRSHRGPWTPSLQLFHTVHTAIGINTSSQASMPVSPVRPPWYHLEMQWQK